MNSLFDDDKMYLRHFDPIHVWQQPHSAFMWDSTVGARGLDS